MTTALTTVETVENVKILPGVLAGVIIDKNYIVWHAMSTGDVYRTGFVPMDLLPKMLQIFKERNIPVTFQPWALSQ